MLRLGSPGAAIGLKEQLVCPVVAVTAIIDQSFALWYSGLAQPLQGTCEMPGEESEGRRSLAIGSLIGVVMV